MLSMLKHAKTTDDSRVQLHRQLLQREAQIGGQLFGQVAVGRRREFFCLDEITWIWHEEWKDQDGTSRRIITRYDILPYGIRKAQDNQPNQFITEAEARHLYAAIDLYNQLVDAELSEELV